MVNASFEADYLRHKQIFEAFAGHVWPVGLDT